MPFELTICEDKNVWDEFVENSPQDNVFCRTAFLDALGKPYDLWLLTEKNRPIAGAILLKDRQGSVLKSPHPFSMYHGVLLDRHIADMPTHRRVGEAQEVFSRMLLRLEQSYDRWSFCLHPNLEDLRAFSWHHYHEPDLGKARIDLYYTGQIHVDNFEKYLGAIRPCKRREYRLAQKKGMLAETSDDLVLLADLYRSTFQRQGLDKSDEDLHLMTSIARSAIEKGFGELLLARLPNGTVVSAALFLHDTHTGYYLIGANHPDYRNTYGGIFIVLESIRRCHERGLKIVDVCGINSPNRGDFKISLNAIPKPYFVVDWMRPDIASTA